MNEFLRGVEYDLDLEEGKLCPADYWDLMGGVGFGGYVLQQQPNLNLFHCIRLSALLLGRLRMSVEEALEELATIGSTIFPKEGEITTPEANLAVLRETLEDMLRRHHFPADVKLNDRAMRTKCKV
jgi:hypothetical protein